MRALLRILLLLGFLLAAAIFLFALVHRDRRPQIYFAAQTGDTNALAQYLALGSNVNNAIVCYRYGGRYASLLHIAAGSAQAGAVSFLIERGANPNLGDLEGNTPLYQVIGTGKRGAASPILQLLLKAGADPNWKSPHSGWTPLIHAALLGSADDVRALLAAGAQVNAPDAQGATPLHYADNAEVAQCLIAAGADRNASFTYVTPADRDHPLPITNTVTPTDSALEWHRLDVLAVLTNKMARTNN